jgi:CBS domain-containing protein
MNVRELMTSPVTTVAPTAAVADIARIMLEEHVGGVPVVDTRGVVIGIVTESDLVAKHARVHMPTYFSILGLSFPVGARHTDEDLRRALAVSAQDLMTRDVVVVGPDTPVDDAATMMVEHHVNPLPVVERGRLVGIVSRTDIVRLLLVEETDAGAAAPVS